VRCAACERALPGVFPGGVVVCACGHSTEIPYEARRAQADPAEGPYRAHAHAAPQATEITCLFCGARGLSGVGPCDVCGVSARAFACAACTHVDGPNARVCSACGNPRPLATLDDPMDAPCPRCGGPLEGRDGVLGCAGCGGTFVTHAGLAELCAAKGTAPPFARTRAARTVSDAAYVACPQCHEVMSRRLFGDATGLVVDVCTVHGTWFDPTELAAALRVAAASEVPIALGTREPLPAPRATPTERPATEEEAGPHFGDVVRWLLGD
jgi:hypothetical protein